MKKCPKCGSEYENDKFYCLNCGMSLIRPVNASKISSPLKNLTGSQDKPKEPAPASQEPAQVNETSEKAPEAQPELSVSAETSPVENSAGNAVESNTNTATESLPENNNTPLMSNVAAADKPFNKKLLIIAAAVTAVLVIAGAIIIPLTMTDNENENDNITASSDEDEATNLSESENNEYEYEETESAADISKPAVIAPYQSGIPGDSALNYMGKTLSYLKNDLGQPDNNSFLNVVSNAMYGYDYYIYGDFCFEYVHYVTESDGSVIEIEPDDNTVISGIYYVGNASVSDDIRMSMTYEELSGHVLFETACPQYYSSYNTYLANGVFSDNYTIYNTAVIFNDDSTSSESICFYVYSPDIAEEYVMTNMPEQTEAVTTEAVTTTEKQSEGTVKLQDGYLNVRDAPGKSGKIIGKLYDKEKVIVEAIDGDWYLIKKDDIHGYVYKEFLVVK